MKTVHCTDCKEIHEFGSMEELQNHLKSEEHRNGMMKDGKVHEHVLAPDADTRMHEHDKITSRTTGKTREISMGPHGGGLVPKNPFASLAQEGYLHAHPEKLGAKELAHWDAETKGKHLPKHK